MIYNITQKIILLSAIFLLTVLKFLYTEAERSVVHVVRRYFCPALRDLIEHGLIKKALQKIDENSPLGLANKRSILLLRPILNCLDSRSRNHSEDKFECLDLNDPSSDYISNSFSGSGSNYIGIHAWDVLMRFYQIKVSEIKIESNIFTFQFHF